MCRCVEEEKMKWQLAVDMLLFLRISVLCRSLFRYSKNRRSEVNTESSAG